MLLGSIGSGGTSEADVVCVDVIGSAYEAGRRGGRKGGVALYNELRFGLIADTELVLRGGKYGGRSCEATILIVALQCFKTESMCVQQQPSKRR